MTLSTYVDLNASGKNMGDEQCAFVMSRFRSFTNTSHGRHTGHPVLTTHTSHGRHTGQPVRNVPIALDDAELAG